MCKLKLAAAGVATWLLLPSALFAIDNESHYGDPEYGRGLATPSRSRNCMPEQRQPEADHPGYLTSK
jgi:hypothetical protein